MQELNTQKKYKGEPVQYSYEKLQQAYFDCRKHKSNTYQAIEFDFEREKNLRKLHDDIINHNYEIGKSICFIVKEPKLREVWAGSFRDRIVHHLIYNALKDRFERRFIYDSYSCIKNKGTLFGAKRAQEFAKNITQNNTVDAYFVKLDIKNYFVNIDKNILYNIISEYIIEDWIDELVKKVIFHDPRKNVCIKSSKKLREKLPQQKSLFNCDINKGLAIGNLVSQFFSNIYLNEVDNFAKRVLKCKYYCRYVDDILIFDKSAGFLNQTYAQINRFLIDNLSLELNHKKKCINHISKGFDFIGHIIKPNHVHLRTRTVNKCKKVLNDWRCSQDRFNQDSLIKFKSSMESYFGLLGHTDAFNLRKQLGDEISCLFINPNSGYTKLKIS